MCNVITAGTGTLSLSLAVFFFCLRECLNIYPDPQLNKNKYFCLKVTRAFISLLYRAGVFKLWGGGGGEN